MRAAPIAVHIRTGARADARAVDQWLAQHALAAVSFERVLDACVHLLTAPRPTSAIAFIGVDWLAQDELEIVDCFAAAWPEATVVLYGADWGQLAAPPDARLRVCRGARELSELLSRAPNELAGMAPSTPAWLTAREVHTLLGGDAC